MNNLGILLKRKAYQIATSSNTHRTVVSNSQDSTSTTNAHVFDPTKSTSTAVPTTVTSSTKTSIVIPKCPIIEEAMRLYEQAINIRRYCIYCDCCVFTVHNICDGRIVILSALLIQRP